jgi:hypothetical protein
LAAPMRGSTTLIPPLVLLVGADCPRSPGMLEQWLQPIRINGT